MTPTRSTTSIRAATVVALAVVLALLGAVPAATGSMLRADEGAVQWSVVPAELEDDEGRVSLRHVVEPGESVEDAIVVTNLGAERSTFTVVAGDGALGGDGAFDLATGEPERGGAWVDVAGLRDGQVTLRAGQSRTLPVTVAVPENATPGDHPAGIVVGRSGSDGAVTVTHRVGVRLHLQVAGDLAPRLEVSDVQTSFEPSLIPFAPGTLRVDYRVANTGNARLGAAGTASGGLPFGLASRSDVTTYDELLPGDEVTMSTEVSAWPTFLMLGDVELAGLVVGEDDVSLPAVVQEGFTRPAISWTGLLALAIIAAVVWWRRRRPGSPAPEAAAEEVREAVEV